MQKFFKYVPAVVLCYLIAMFLHAGRVGYGRDQDHHLPESGSVLLGSAFLVSAIATNVGNKLYALTNFSDKATWTVLFVTVGIRMALMGYVVGTPLAVVCAHIMESLA